jgi:hypothetical protein
MNVNGFINEINALQKTALNPRVILANGKDVLAVDYISGENTLVIYSSDDISSEQVANVPADSDRMTIPSPEVSLPETETPVEEEVPVEVEEVEIVKEKKKK